MDGNSTNAPATHAIAPRQPSRGAPDTENRFFWRSSTRSGMRMRETRAGRFPPAPSAWYAHSSGAAGDQAKSWTPSSFRERLSSRPISGVSYTLIAPRPSRAKYLRSIASTLLARR